MQNDLTHFVPMAEVSTRGVLCKKFFLQMKACNFTYTPTPVFLCEFFELFMDSVF